MSELDLATIRHALKVARQNGVREVELQAGESRFSGVLGWTEVKSSSPVLGVAAVEDPSDGVPETTPITSPCVGIYKPAGATFAAGSAVEKGQIVAVIQALGLANDVESPVSGEIEEVLVKPDQPVEFGQTLAKVKVL
ncbi:MAG TPA: hypothetical protein PLX06_02290 [Fimbriimonadaceae bacterium]|nr:hypothetical protein [Fimbriimonadaceae bacterium]